MSTTQMSPLPSQVTARTRWAVLSCLLALVMGLVMLLASFGLRAFAAESPVDLGTAATYSALGGSTVTNTGPSTLDGDVGVFSGTAITGFPPGDIGGEEHAGDTEAAGAQADLVIAYNDAAGRAPINDTNYNTLVGRNLVSGVYNATSTMSLTGTVTLDGEGRTDGVWIFQVGSGLNIASNSTVNLTGGANACNVFWQVGSSAVIGTNSDFVGTVMALTSITVQTGATVEGRALARNGAVTLDNNEFTGSDCEQITPSPSDSSSPTDTSSPTATATSTDSTSPTATATESATESASPTATATESASPTVTASQSATESASATVTASQSETEGPTETSSDFETESEVATTSTTGTGGGLASTGSSGLTSILAVGGLALLAVGGALLITGRLRPRHHGRHQG